MNKVSFNIKAKKKCDADSMLLHSVDLKARSKSDNIIRPSRTAHNVTSKDLHLNYLRATKRVEEIKKKSIQKNANHYLEGVLAFSPEQVLKMGEKSFRTAAPELIEEYGRKIGAEFGFEYLGFSLHFDEGKVDENGKFECNYHAHLSFVNFDFNTNKARFREIQEKFVSKKKYPNKAFVKMQDIAGETFSKIGFKRGVSKEITGRKHLEKAEYKLLAEVREKADKLSAENELIKVENTNLISEIEAKKVEINKLNSSVSILSTMAEDIYSSVVDRLVRWLKRATPELSNEIANEINQFKDKGKLPGELEKVENNLKIPNPARITPKLR